MMSLGPLAFLSPALLAALLVLPLIWWLLRVTPPGPERVPFPPTRILVGIERREEDRAHSPWWLTLIRLLAAGAVILALARPVLNPQQRDIRAADLHVLLIDNGWAAAGDWRQRLANASQLVEQLRETGRPLLLLTSADGDDPAPASNGDAGKALEQLSGLEPQPWAPDRARMLRRLQQALDGGKRAEIYYLADGLDYGKDSAFLTSLASLAGGGGVTLITAGRGSGSTAAGPLALHVGSDAEVKPRILSPGGFERTGRILALDGKSRVLAAAPFSLQAADRSLDVAVELPLELRNQIARIEIEGIASAGATYLLDGEANRRRVGLVSGETAEEAQPLLSSLYYLRKALAPFAEIAVSNDSNTATAVAELLRQNVTTLAMAGIGRVGSEAAARLEDWLARGGILVRFAGPRLEQGADDLLPVDLRQGERSLGGALSWSQPQPLAPFEDGSPFHGLTLPNDVSVSRQVLADPSSLSGETLVWARLADGTPLVTAKKRGRGLVILFHVTANSDWSSLPLSGLFVDMLRRISALSPGIIPQDATAGATDTKPAADSTTTASDTGSPILPPLRLIDGYGRPAAPAGRAEPVRLSELASLAPSPAHPPGIYGAGELTRALNVTRAETRLEPLQAPAGIATEVMSGTETHPIGPYLLTLALLLFLADALIIALTRGLTNTGRAAAPRAALLLAGVLLLALSPVSSRAETASRTSRDAQAERFALDATLTTRLAFVRTGDPVIDRNSYLGLAALSRRLAARTAFEPGDPVGVDVARDELAFFPLLYWPLPDSIERLDDNATARVNAYMKQGGLIVFDTRDEATAAIDALDAAGESRIARLIGRLDIPPLAPVANDHVLTRSFYLLDGFPGRWNSGRLWAEAGSVDTGKEEAPAARSADGVSSILITSNDLAGAWAANDDDTPLNAAVPGGEAQRELAYRGGINMVMYALTGNYKSDQVHLPALMHRLGQ